MQLCIGIGICLLKTKTKLRLPTVYGKTLPGVGEAGSRIVPRQKTQTTLRLVDTLYFRTLIYIGVTFD